MEAARQRVRAAAARKKEEEKATKGKDETSLLAPKTVARGSVKRKNDGKDECPLKKLTVTTGDAHPKKKSPSKPVYGAGKGMMTSSGPIIEGPHFLLTHKDYAVEEIESLIKPTNIDPCAQLGTEELGVSAFFNLTRVSILPWYTLPHLFLVLLLTTLSFTGLGTC